jgi:hypothetical protein
MILLGLHQASDVRGEEIRFKRVDDVEKELTTHSLILALTNVKIWKVLNQHFVFCY